MYLIFEEADTRNCPDVAAAVEFALLSDRDLCEWRVNFVLEPDPELFWTAAPLDPRGVLAPHPNDLARLVRYRKLTLMPFLPEDMQEMSFEWLDALPGIRWRPDFV